MKKGFAGHLYHRLRSHGIRVFLDKQEMQEGDNLTSQIIGAINTASVHVAIFSENYAESNWCLKELVLMLESSKSGATIIPVFHGVKPADLRWTQGEYRGYAQGLHKLKVKTDKGKRRYDPDTIEEWRRALSRVADISGFELEACNGDEGELVEKIDERVSRIVKKERFNVPKYEIGLDVKVKDFEAKFLSPQDREKPQAVGIVGLRGVGKTTLAKELFHRKSSSFIRSYFLSDVRENANKKSLPSLFEELVDGLIRFDPQIYNDLESKLESFKEHPSLVVLDGVEHVDQLDALLRIKKSLSSNSLILITSGDRDVLKRLAEEASVYKLTRLNTQQSRKLFCFHAFGEAAGPRPGYEYLVDEFLTVCEGLPLSLKVLGAFLHGKNDRSYWEDQLDMLQQTLPHEIDKKLKISYDALNAEEKQMFLDIACVFIGESTDTAIRIWRGSGWRGLLGFQSLLEKQLVEVDSENCINMHDHLKDLGKTIAKETGLRRPLGPLTDNNACLMQNSSSVITELRRKIDDLLQQSSAITELRGKIDDLLQQSSAITEMPGKIDDLLQQSSVITELREKIDGLVQQSSVITELREKIDGLVQQSSV